MPRGRKPSLEKRLKPYAIEPGDKPGWFSCKRCKAEWTTEGGLFGSKTKGLTQPWARWKLCPKGCNERDVKNAEESGYRFDIR
jgi:hypothetical protein